jgi:hypothetical protein
VKKEELTNRLDRIVDSGMEKTRQFYSMWNENLRYFFSDQLHNVKARKNWEWVVLNYIWPSAMQEIAKLTKNNPKIIVQPWEPNDTDKAEVWEKKLQWDWKQGINNHGMRLEQIKAILDGKLFGYRVSKIYWEDKCYWDEESQQWMGDVKHKLWHPAMFWADGDECIDEGNCGTERYATLEWAQSRWPKFKKELEESALTWNEIEKDLKAYDIGKGSILQGQKSIQDEEGTGGKDCFDGDPSSTRLLDIIMGFDPLSHTGQTSDQKFVKIQEIYLKDYEETKIKEEQDANPQELLASGQIFEANGRIYDTASGDEMLPETWPKQTIREYTKPKFPNGRYIMRVGDTILNSKEEEQVYPYSRWPFVVVPHYLLPHMWQGVDAVQLYKSTQDMVNITVDERF